MDWYLETVKAYPIASAMVQFAILGTFGEVVSHWVRGGRGMPFGAAVTLQKMVGWAVLAVAIKYAFTGFTGFVDALTAHHLLPAATGQVGGLHAFFKSAFTNLLFGPFLVVSHRWIDNLIERRDNWANLKGALLSLLWFWVPAHTVTFMLPVPLQIGLAAVWSLALGVILGFFARPGAAPSAPAVDTDRDARRAA